MTVSPRFLTPPEWTAQTQRTRIELTYRVHVAGQWQDRPFVIEVDGRPLAALIESAAVGHRLYEFMHLRRPGDLLWHWWVTAVDLGPELIDHVTRRLTLADRTLFARHKPPLELPFPTFDACFWQQETRWFNGDDAADVERVWVAYRRRNPSPVGLRVMFEIVRATQARLRASPDRLLQHELALIDSCTHARDCWARPAPTYPRSSEPADKSSLDPGLLELITSLARRADIRSISCPFEDRVLWRALVWEQVQRAAAQCLPPREALFLAGPDSGLKDVEAEDWGGDIHIPYEGACAADLFIKPRWFAFHRESATASGSVRAGLGDKAQRYALAHGDLGEFPLDERVRCGDWTLYRFHG